MIENELTDALITAIKGAVNDLRLPVKNGEPRAPIVFNGYLPPKRSKSESDDIPCVVVRPENGDINDDETEVTISIIIVCYSEEFDGYLHCMNVMQRIKNLLCSLENGILDKRFVLKLPMKWENIADQPYPNWQVEMETHWCFNTPQPIF